MWSPVPLPTTGASGTLRGVKAFGPADVWAVGSSATAKPLVLHWTGTAWSVVSSPNPDPGSDSLLAIGGVASNDLWAVGQQGADETLTGVPPGTRTLIEHWDGKAWSVVACPDTGDQDPDPEGTVAVSLAGPVRHPGRG
jgi:hypothetical protein